jgi:hypothetical protein
MGFQKIGPYELSRSDLVAACLVISFRIGSTGARIWAGVFVLIGLVGIGIGIVTRDPVGVAIGTGLLAFIFVITPALRKSRRTGGVCLFYDNDGLVAETGEMRTTYKWATIRSFRKIGSRLYIMISGGCALVIADRMTNTENMADLVATLVQHQAA